MAEPLDFLTAYTNAERPYVQGAQDQRALAKKGMIENILARRAAGDTLTNTSLQGANTIANTAQVQGISTPHAIDLTGMTKGNVAAGSQLRNAADFANTGTGLAHLASGGVFTAPGKNINPLSIPTRAAETDLPTGVATAQAGKASTTEQQSSQTEKSGTDASKGSMKQTDKTTVTQKTPDATALEAFAARRRGESMPLPIPPGPNATAQAAAPVPPTADVIDIVTKFAAGATNVELEEDGVIYGDGVRRTKPNPALAAYFAKNGGQRGKRLVINTGQQQGQMNSP